MLNRLLYSCIIILCMSYPLLIFAQPSRIEHLDRLGDSLQLVDIMPQVERIPLDKDYKGGWSVGANLQTNGWGIQVHVDIHNKNMILDAAYRNKFFNALQIYYHLGEQKHAKEISSLQIQGNGSSPYRLGKINRFYFQELGLAYKKGWGSKLDENSISLSWITGLHLNIGLQKPYYLDISGLGEVAFAEDNEQDFLNPGLIMGKGEYFKGFDELKVKMGVGIKTGLFFNFAKKNKRISGLYIYSGIDYYFEEVAIFYDDSSSTFYHFGIALHFGKYY